MAGREFSCAALVRILGELPPAPRYRVALLLGLLRNAGVAAVGLGVGALAFLHI